VQVKKQKGLAAGVRTDEGYADVFESVAAEIIGAMILGGTLAREATPSVVPNPIQMVFFPLCVHAMDILVSSVGIISGTFLLVLCVSNSLLHSTYYS
jgi:Na+/H+-translocating membrane pyrophosphatase